jgi:hypothetical protein
MWNLNNNIQSNAKGHNNRSYTYLCYLMILIWTNSIVSYLINRQSKNFKITIRIDVKSCEWFVISYSERWEGFVEV